MSTTDYLTENELRKKKLFPYYSPLTGEGSPIPRFPVILNDKTTIYLPDVTKPMFPDPLCKDLPKFCKEIGVDVGDMMVYIEQVRYMHDFEYWCATCVKVTDKGGSELIFLTLRASQRTLFARLYKMFINGKPIKALLVKARQFGGSTVIQIFMVWLQIFHFKNWNSLIFGNKESQARVIRGMYTRLLKYHPVEVFEGRFTPFEHSSKTKVLNEGDRDCIISIGSMSDPEGVRSEDIRMAHLTEVASWKKTEGKGPEDVIQNVRATIPNIRGAVEILESTAKGVGNFWHNEYLAAKQGKTNYDPIFISFFEIEMYYLDFETEEQKLQLIAQIDKPQKDNKEHERSRSLWLMGAPLESVNWYWNKKKGDRYSDWRMASEFPGNDIEAFQSAETRAFDPDYVQKARINNCDPIFVGDIVGDAEKGKKAFENLRFVANPQGPLKIWAFPDTERKIANRYVGPMDIGGKGYKSDNSVISILDRVELMYGGVPEAVATWCGHLDHDLLAFKGAQLCKIYNNALYAPESNSYDKESVTEGDHMVTILDQVLPFYPNIFCRTDPEKIRQGYPARYGFHTNKSSKPDLISTINAAFRDEGYIEFDEEVCNEADQYEIIDGNKYGGAIGCHDDRLMSRAIGVKVSELMPMPFMVEDKAPKRDRVVSKTEAVL